MAVIKFGISADFPCGYLDGQQERLLVYMDEQPLTPMMYSALQNQGFRRSENYVYKPHCQNCRSCQSLRLPVFNFSPSRSQKRLLNKSKHFHLALSKENKPEYYPLFEKYVNTKHFAGVMYPASPSQLSSFTDCDWIEKLFIELYDQDKLIAVAIADVTPDSLSAVYTFYDPDYSSYSLGSLMILQQINMTKHLAKNWLYLGYYIEECDKMNYKTNFKPCQLLKNGNWIELV